MLSVSELKSHISNLSEHESNELLFFLAGRDKTVTDDILTSLMFKLSVSIPELENMSEASKVKRLLKLFSLLIYEYNHLTYDELYNNFFLHSASGEFLDEYAIESGVPDGRRVMTKAIGWIRVGSSKEPDPAVTLPLLFTVSNEDASLKYKAITQVTIDKSTAVVDDEGVYWSPEAVRIEAVEGGSAYNIPVSEITTILTSVAGFDRILPVEKEYDEDGELINADKLSTSGGLDRESDESLRARILEKKKADFLLSDSYFITKTKEAFRGVSDMKVIRTPEGFGTIGLVIDTRDTELINEITAHWNNQSVRLLGFKVFVYPYVSIDLELSIELYHLNPDLLDVSGFNTIAHNYVEKLKIGEPFVKEYFEKELVELAIDRQVKYFKTISPTDDIVKASRNEKIVLSSSRVIFTKKVYTDE